MKRKYIKGFTLVELIVVLAILAILAAMLIPSLTGYIDKAKEKEDVSNARTVLVSSQSVLSELWAIDSDSVCDAKHRYNDGQYACTVFLPVTNSSKSPNPNAKDYKTVRRYVDTYNLASDVFSKNKTIYFAVFAQEGVAKEAIYYSPDTKNCFKWTKDSQEWNKVEYYKDIWKELYKLCDYNDTLPNWNGGTMYSPD